MTRKTDPIEYKPGTPDSQGTDVKSTEMLKGRGSLNSAQTGRNEVKPYTTSGSQPGKGELGGS